MATPLHNTTINVIPSNDVPIANDDVYLCPPNTDLIIPINSLISNDLDPDDELVVNLLTSPEEGLLTDLGDGEFKYTPTPDFFGVLDFDLVSDGELLRACKSFNSY